MTQATERFYIRSKERGFLGNSFEKSVLMKTNKPPTIMQMHRLYAAARLLGCDVKEVPAAWYKKGATCTRYYKYTKANKEKNDD